MTDIDGARPTRTLLRLLAPHRWPIAGSVVLFAIKDSPLWVLPILTARIIDVVVRGGEPAELWLYAALAIGVLVLNYPGHVLFVRLFAGGGAPARR